MADFDQFTDSLHQSLRFQIFNSCSIRVAYACRVTFPSPASQSLLVREEELTLSSFTQCMMSQCIGHYFYIARLVPVYFCQSRHSVI